MHTSCKQIATVVTIKIYLEFCPYSANTYAIKGKRKTITPNDLFQAIEDMELQEFLPEMKECLDGTCIIC